jgi:hypothetical protein
VTTSTRTRRRRVRPHNVPSFLRHGCITEDALRRMHRAEREVTRELIRAIPEDARPRDAFPLWRQLLRRLEHTFPPEGRSRGMANFLRHHNRLIDRLVPEEDQ